MKRLMLVLLCLLCVGTTSAFQPRTGHWWNPNESGRGFNIDIQDNVLVVAMYTYQAGGPAQWYLASGAMTNSGRNFSGTLDKYQGGQCASCAYTGRPTLVGNDGIISISFASETSAIVTLPGGRTTSIQPFNFAIGEPPQGLLGEWIFVYDIGSTTFAERFNFTVTGSATSGGNGIVIDLSRYASCEQQVSGTFAGYVVCFDWTTSSLSTLANQYKFRFGLDQTYDGTWISPTSYNSYAMQGFKIESKSGISRSSTGRKDALFAMDESNSEQPAPVRVSCEPMIPVVNAEMAALIEETRQILCGR